MLPLDSPVTTECQRRYDALAKAAVAAEGILREWWTTQRT
jgi:hypothetical protein